MFKRKKHCYLTSFSSVFQKTEKTFANRTWHTSTEPKADAGSANDTEFANRYSNFQTKSPRITDAIFQYRVGAVASYPNPRILSQTLPFWHQFLNNDGVCFTEDLFFFKCEPRFRTYWKGAAKQKQMLKYIQYQFCLIAMVNGSLYESAVCTNRTWNKAAQSKGEPRSVVLNSWSVFSPLFLSVSWSWTLHLLTGTLRWTRAFE